MPPNATLNQRVSPLVCEKNEFIYQTQPDQQNKKIVGEDPSLQTLFKSNIAIHVGPIRK